jgi:hypothetical protein
MMAQLHTLKVGKLADSSRFEYGPMAFYHPLIADGDTPVRTGIQTSAPGYVTPMHWHPYVELLFITARHRPRPQCGCSASTPIQDAS